MNRSEILQTAKPILFNTDMVRAILEGRKTVTRRKVKPMPHCTLPIDCWCWGCKGETSGFCNADDLEFPKQPYQPGDILYVRETWSEWTGGYLYRAWWEGIAQPGAFPGEKWRPSIHMPKEAARIFLRVTDMRVERLQEMSYIDSLKEGIVVETKGVGVQHIAEQKYKKLWNSTIPKKDLDKYGWDANPWVWVIEFEKVEVKPWKE